MDKMACHFDALPGPPAVRGKRRALRWLCLPWLLGVVACGPGAGPAAASTPEPVLAIDFDQLAQGRLPAGVQIRTQFPAPDVVPGIEGHAWRTDGFSSFAEAALQLDPRSGFTLTFWVALESHPSDREVPVRDLMPSSLAQQAAGGSGFDLAIDTFGRWRFELATSAGRLQAAAPDRFPLGRWVHVAVRVDAANGVVQLFQDGQPVASAIGRAGMTLELASVPLRLASPPKEARILDFVVNRINGAYDQIAVYPRALGDNEIARSALLPTGAPRDAQASLVVPASRFAADHLRPQVHPMPPANWANEPHGLVRFNGQWHLFYQRTPNGPFKTQMHWGHMASSDLVRWQHLPDALRPELQSPDFGYDMKGIWSGHVIVDGGKAFAFYTSVNHGDRLAASNPGISMATSDDPMLRDWRKQGPILNSQGLKDFRDPFLWREGGTWHMLIGAALDSGGGLQYLVLEQTAAGPRWQRRARFAEPGWRQLDNGSDIWEMPVFVQLSDDVWLLLVNPIGGRVSKYGEPATRAIYWTGQWSNGLFRPFSATPKPLDLLPGHLAPTVARADDGSLRAIGIIDERRTPAAQQRAGWAHTFSLPRLWSLLPDQRTLGQAPAPELAALRGTPLPPRDGALPVAATTVVSGLRAYEIEVALDPAAPAAGTLHLDVLAAPDGREATRLVFDLGQQTVGADLSQSSLSGEREGPATLRAPYDAQAFGPMRRLRVFVDGSTVEVFINDAAAYAIRSYPAHSTSTLARLSVAAEQPIPANVRVWPLGAPTR